MKTDRTVGAFEAKTHLSQLLDEVQAGARITITRRGKAVAVLQAEGTPSSSYAEQVEAVVHAVRERRGKYAVTPEDLAEWKQEGRK